MYVRSELKATYCHELTESHETHDAIYVKINSKSIKQTRTSGQHSLLVGGYYRHCKKSDVVTFIDKFSNDLAHKALRKNDVLIAGDFNICLMKSTHSNDSLYFLNSIISSHYEILIFKPTRIQYHKNSLQVKSASLIDQIVTNLFQYDCKSGNLHYPDSDHFANFVIFESYKNKSLRSEVPLMIRQVNRVNEEKLNSDFSSYNWESLVYNEPNLDKAVENLSNSIQEQCDKHAPLTAPSNRMLKHLKKPWIDNTLLSLIQQKNRAYTTKTNIPTAINRSAYDRLNRTVTAQLRKKRKQYFKDYFSRFRTNSKKMWHGINLALEQTKNKKSLPSIIKGTDGKPIEGDKNIANAFAKYFETIPGKTKNKIPAYRHDYMYYMNRSKATDSYLVLNDTNTKEVFKYIMKLKNSSSPGPSNVPNMFLKKLGKPLSEVLTHIANRSMNSGYVPNAMKIGKQTPVHKGGEICISNYRPITVCSSIAKILEKIVRDRVMGYIDRLKILNKSQFGFRSKHSTNHAVLNLTESTLELLEKGLKVGGTYLDIAKAFDSVNHDILLRKLEYYGFRANTLMWFESYLKGRKQFVSIRREKSDIYELEWGIPQGGTLAPILFILFMNDITNSSDKFDFSIYADDTCLILGIENSLYDDTMKNELQKVVDWFSSNELLLNFKKTDYLNFGPHFKKVFEKGEHDMTELHEIAPFFLLVESENDTEMDIKELNKKGEFILHDLHKITPNYLVHENIEMPDGTNIFEPETVKYLGVIMDNQFTFKRHIDVLNCKINRVVGILWKCQHLTFEAKKMIYTGLVEAHLNYGIVTWASAFAKNITSTHASDHIPKSLQYIAKTQNKVIRAIFRKPNYDKNTKTPTSVTPLYKELNVLKLCDLFYYNLACLAHDYFHTNTLPLKLSEKLCKQSDISDRSTRNSSFNFHYKTPHNILSQRQPSVAIAAYWNCLPASVKLCKNKNTFKNKLKTYLTEKY